MFGQWLSNLDLDIDSDVTMLITRTIKNWSHVLRQVTQEKFFFLLTSSFLSGIWSLLRGLTKLPSAKTLGACGWQNYFHLKKILFCAPWLFSCQLNPINFIQIQILIQNGCVVARNLLRYWILMYSNKWSQSVFKCF